MEPAAHPVMRSGAEIEQLVARQQLLRPGRPVVVMLSGGRDSTCLLDLCVRLAGRDATTALHFNYGLRATAYEDEEACRLLCERLGVSLAVRRAQQPPRGNVQAWARDQRYASAREMAARRGADAATGHTATDRVEGLLYRLAASPGRRALVGMRPCAGRLVRPLLSIHRHETAAYCRERGLPFVEDPTNESPAFARNRIRHGLLTALREVHPAAEANVLSTLGILGDEAEVLDDLVARALEDAGQPPRVERLQALAPALRRLAVQALADRAAGGMAPAIAERVEEILALGGRGGTAVLHLPSGLRAEVSYGRLRFALEGRDGQRQTDPPADGWLPIPGRLAFAGGEISSRRGSFPVADGTLDADALADRLHVRSWQPGDRMRPLGLRGSKTLQDIFTDAKVPSSERTRLPVVVSGGEIAWIPGVATGEAFRVRGSCTETVRLVWSPGNRIVRVRRDPAIGEILVQPDELQHRVRQLASEISRDYAGRELLLVCVLKGAVFFLSDLMREIEIPCEVDFMAVASYGSATDSSGVVRILKDLDTVIEGRDVLIVEDIVDSGLTLSYLLRNLRARGPRSLEVCALLTKPERRKVELPARYVGFEIPDRFAIGYGLDHGERYRNLPFVAALAQAE